MAGIPLPLIKFVAVGKIRAVQDWSTGIYAVATLSPGPLSQSQLNNTCAAIELLFNTWWTTLKPKASPQTDYRGVNAYYYGPNSTRADLVANSPRAATAGTAPGSPLPAYCSLVASFRTGTPGRSGRGRSYFPYQLANLDSTTMQVSVTDCNALTGAYSTLLNGINAATPSGGGVSKLESSIASFTKGLAYTISQVVVDSKPDTQHRREDVLDPVTFSVQPVVP